MSMNFLYKNILQCILMYFFPEIIFFFFLPDSQRIQCSKITKIQKQSPEKVSPLHGADLTGGAPWQGRTSLSLSPGKATTLSQKQEDAPPYLSLTDARHMEQVEDKRDLSIFSSLAKNI